MLFLFKVIEDTDHGTPTHNVNNCFNYAHNSFFIMFDVHNIDTFEKKFKKHGRFFAVKSLFNII